MAVANAVRPDRPSTRSTRGTKDTGERNNGTRNTNRSTARDRKVESLNDRRVRPSTGGVKEASVQKPRRKASTRNQTMSDPERPSTRNRPSTRGGSGSAQVKNDYARVESPPLKGSKGSKGSDSRPSRTKAFEERREAKRFVAPIRFIAVMFLVIVVSVFAFGLLRGDPVVQQSNKSAGDDVKVIYEKEGTTSTNTGILRGH
jgi:hypothetical protein